jgi:putative hemolysin
MLQSLFDDLDEDAITWLVVANNANILLVATLVGHLTVATLGPEHYSATALAALVFILAVCEVTPKTYASHHADRVSLRVVRWVAPLARSWPARAGLALIKAASWPVRRLLRVDSMHRHLRVTDEELMSLADVAEEQAVLDATQAQMFESIVEFANQTVREIMVPRVDIVSVDAEATLSEIVEVIRSEGKSRIAVSQGADDPAVGMVYANDVLACLQRGELDRRARDLVRDVHMVPDTKPVDELFREMRDRHIHIALVIDEHGSVDGLVSMEDVLEEIVGDMQDEHDTDEEPLVQALADGSYLVQGGATRSELLDALGVTLSEDDGEFDTLGGFLFQCAEEIPEPGFRTEYAGFVFEVAAMDGTRITQVAVRRVEPPEGAGR